MYKCSVCGCKYHDIIQARWNRDLQHTWLVTSVILYDWCAVSLDDVSYSVLSLPWQTAQSQATTLMHTVQSTEVESEPSITSFIEWAKVLPSPFALTTKYSTGGFPLHVARCVYTRFPPTSTYSPWDKLAALWGTFWPFHYGNERTSPCINAWKCVGEI